MERVKMFENTVKHTRFEQLSASSDIGQGVIMGYEQALKDMASQSYANIINKIIQPSTENTLKSVIGQILEQIKDCIERSNHHFDVEPNEESKKYWEGCQNAYLSAYQIIEKQIT